jgi:hypothetical protein
MTLLRRIALTCLAFALATSAALAQPVTPSGTWAALPSSALRPALAPIAGVNLASFFDYSGGWWDEDRQELAVWGGGHGDYPGNEVCRFPLATGRWSCTARSPYVADPTTEMTADGRPSARHTYACHVRVNVPGYDGMFCHGGSLWRLGYSTAATWFYHRDTETWERLANRPPGDYGATSLATYAAWDSVRERVLVRTRNAVLSFSFVTKAWAYQGAADWTERNASAAYDPVRQVFVVLGGGRLEAWSTAASPWVRLSASASGETAPVTAQGPGLVYDPVGQRYLAHTGGRDLYAINRDTWAIMRVAGAGADPGPAYVSSGNMGRFRYVAKTHGLLVVSTVDSGVFYHQLAGTVPIPPPTPPPAPSPSPPGALIPLDTWVAIKAPSALTGPGVLAALYEKHMTAAYSPKTKRLYFTGGDTRAHFVGPGGVDFGSASYYQATHSLDLTARLQAPGQVNAGWATEHAYCAGPGEVVPKRPDFVGFTWVAWLDRFVLVPGEFYVGDSANCPGETSAYAGDPQYPWRQIMDFDVTTRQWTVRSANHGAVYVGNDFPWQTVADPTTRQLIRLESNGNLVADHYDPATDKWTYYPTTGNGLNCMKSHLAFLDRTIYCADREHGLFGAYNVDTHAARVVGPLPGSAWCCMSVPADKGYLFAVPSARKIVYVELLPATQTWQVWAWSPEAPTWVRIDTFPWQTLDGEALPAGEMPHGTSGAVDTDRGLLYLTGEYGGTAAYSWVIALSPSATPPAPSPPPTPPPPPSVPTVTIRLGVPACVADTPPCVAVEVEHVVIP